MPKLFAWGAEKESRCFLVGLLAGAVSLAPLDFFSMLFSFFILTSLYIDFKKILIRLEAVISSYTRLDGIIHIIPIILIDLLLFSLISI